MLGNCIMYNWQEQSKVLLKRITLNSLVLLTPHSEFFFPFLELVHCSIAERILYGIILFKSFQAASVETQTSMN